MIGRVVPKADIRVAQRQRVYGRGSSYERKTLVFTSAGLDINNGNNLHSPQSGIRDDEAA